MLSHPPGAFPTLPLRQGNRERYYEPSNSLLDEVLTQREGIPISLAVLAVAVAARVGLPLVPLNVPMHVLCGLEGEGGGHTPLCMDVFDGGRIMDG